MKIKFNSSIIILGIELMLFISLFDSILPPIVKYLDDLFCAILAVLFVFNIITGKRVFNFYILIILLIPIGLIGNVVYDIQPNLLIAITDGFMFLKPYILLMYITTTISDTQANYIYNSITKLSKLVITVLFVFSLIPILLKGIVDNSLDLQNYFVFYSGFTGTVSMIAILCMAVIVSDSHNNRVLYYILCSFVIIRTGSGLGILAIVVYAAVYWFFEKKKGFHWYYLLAVVLLCIWVGWNEISGYLLNQNAPRYLLFDYSFVTAWNCLPIGSGFASYGSSLAATYYSSLYYQYGFSNRWGMSKGDTSFLMDSYYPQIIAQTGFLGSILYVAFICNLFFKLIWPIKNITIKCSSVFLFAIWAASGLGFGCGSVWGCLVYTVIPILYLADRQNGMTFKI